jgi:sterol desaturase/sphingolipid hydroxylase (fatty acid hydroxylase superfamily)/creatinine amidohydrolase/Fe(II)-dependent formamide hydrolase-like protein
MAINLSMPVSELAAWAAALAAAPFLQVFLRTSLFWWPFLLSSIAIALAVFWAGHGRSRAALGEFRRRFLSGRIWLHPSTRADYRFYLVNFFLYPLFFGPLTVGGATIAEALQSALSATFGPIDGPAVDLAIARAIYTVAFFVAYDFGRFVAHSLLHDVPWLWEFHKVHHSAEALTPLTNHRVHPVDLFVLMTVPTFTAGIVSGLAWYLSGGEIGVYTVLGLNVGIAAFNTIANLRHWEVWISFGPVLNRWLISPAHHQIHHSREPRHWGKNRGFELAIWDRLFGTLYAPVDGETFALGLGDGSDGAWHSVCHMYLWPFRFILARLGWGAPPIAAASVPAVPKSMAPVAVSRRRILAAGLGGAGLTLLPSSPARADPRPDLFIENLTWVELSAAVAAGTRTAIVPTGGMEQNGPHMAIGKHNVIVRFTAGEIARRLGQAVVAPVVPYVPEGGFAPPTGHMTYPGTVGVSPETFAAVLRDVAQSLALAGFTLICFVGDHGDAQAVQDQVAASLSSAWQVQGVHVANLGRYYAANGQEAWLKGEGFSAAEIGRHAGLLDTAELMALAPTDVRAGLLSPHVWPAGNTGVAGDPSRASGEVGAILLELKIRAGVAEARDILAKLQAPAH